MTERAPVRALRHATLLLTWTLVTAVPSRTFAQSATPTPAPALAPPNAQLDAEFASILSVRELSDGRVLVTDDREKRLVVADFRSNAITPLGRIGRGPGEYGGVGRLVATRGDSTLMSDSEAGPRWLVIAGARIVATLTPDDPGLAAAAGSLLGADTQGRVLARRGLPFTKLGAGRQRTEGTLLRVDRASGRADSITTAHGFVIETRVGGTETTPTYSSFQVVFSVSEQSMLFPDGWVAVARQDPYRVDWHPPTGPAVRGAPLPWTPVRVTTAEKEAWEAGIRATSTRTVAWDHTMYPFAETIPPYRTAALLPMPDGSLLILRHPSTASPGPDYDVVDRRGALVRAFRLRADERIVGFGAASVYVVVTDDDGIQRLRRHPWR